MIETVEISRTLLDYLDRQLKWYKADIVALRTERDELRAEIAELRARLAETMAAMRATGRGEGQG